MTGQAVAEYMDGGELTGRCSELQPLLECEAARIMRQLLQALAHLHARRICHTDIKPENILFVTRWAALHLNAFVSCYVP